MAAELRAAGQYVPILMLTARGRPEDVLRGFEAGADDYLPKPFELPILHRARQRPAAPPPVERAAIAAAAAPPRRRPTSYAFAGRTLDFAAMEIRADGKAYQLTQMECDLLRIWCGTPARPCRAARSSKTSGTCTRAPTRAPSTTSSCGCGATSRIAPASPQFLLTVRGVGYKFVPDGSEARQSSLQAAAWTA